MNHIKITDIFGQKLFKEDPDRNEIPFIIIHTIQPHLLLEKIDRSIPHLYQLIYPTIKHVLRHNSIEPSRFAPLGNNMIPDNELPKRFKILLVNTKYSVYPDRFRKIGQYGTLNIWKPVSGKDVNATAVGYIASPGEPPLNSMRLVYDQFVKKYTKKQFCNQGICTMNEFFLLSAGNDQPITIDRTSLLSTNKTIRLTSRQGGTITDDSSFVKLKSGPGGTSGYQGINYTIQGELRMGGRCLTTNDDENVFLRECDNEDTQKWYPWGNKFVSNHNQSCLTDYGGGLKTKQCDDNYDQNWHIESLDVIEQSNQEKTGGWKTEYGKRVVLIEPDEPWYINRNQNRKPEGIIHQDVKVLNEKEYRDDADFYSTFMLDIDKGDVGYGHSYAARKGKPCLCLDDCNKMPKNPENRFVLEHFGKKKYNYKWLLIILCLILVFLALFVTRNYFSRSSIIQ